MKRVVKRELVPSDAITSDAANRISYYLVLDEEAARCRALTLQDAYLLRYEVGEGYIFRCMTDKSGHSGHSEALSEAIDRAFSVGQWAVYQFDSLEEALKYLLNIRGVKLDGGAK